MALVFRAKYLPAVFAFACAGVFALGSSTASAQDLGDTLTSGASTRAPAPPIPQKELEQEVRVLPDKTKPASDYLIPCGQGCAFEAGQEAMAVLAFYFQHQKISSQLVKTDTYIDNVKKCTANAEACRNDEGAKQRMLESALHYQFGKDIRAAYLTNATNRENIRSFGYQEGDEVSAETSANLGYKWFQGESTWKTIQGKLDVRIQDQRERDNYQFDLNQIGTKETEQQKLAELDPEFVKQYQAYFNAFSPYNDRAFVKARALGRNGRGIASKENADPTEEPNYVLDPKKEQKDPKDMYELHEGIKRDVNRGVNFDVLRDASKAAAGKANPKNPAELDKIPHIFSSDDYYFEIKAKDIKRYQNDLAAYLKEAKDDPKFGEQFRNKLVELGVPKELANEKDLKEDALKKALADAAVENKKKMDEGKSSLQIATDINKKVDQVVQSRKMASDADRKSINVTLDIESFDNFLEKIWPTDEGTKYRTQLLEQVQRRKGEKITIDDF